MSSALINVMTGVALKAGKGLLRDFGEVGNLQISRKGAADFVTNADTRTEKLLQRELSKARPGYGFLLEEGGEIAGSDNEYRWIIDPLDGTTNFIHAIPYFCVSIGLEKRGPSGKREIVAGVIFDPIHNELFAAEKGSGAMLNDRRLRVTAREQLEEAMLVTGNPRHLMKTGKTAGPIFDDVSKSGAILRYFGATALDLAYVAAGRCDGCWHYTIQPWDIAAGMLLVEEAGGIVSEIDGAPAHAHSKNVMASNRMLHAPIRQLLAKTA